MLGLKRRFIGQDPIVILYRIGKGEGDVVSQSGVFLAWELGPPANFEGKLLGENFFAISCIYRTKNTDASIISVAIMAIEMFTNREQVRQQNQVYLLFMRTFASETCSAGVRITPSVWERILLTVA